MSGVRQKTKASAIGDGSNSWVEFVGDKRHVSTLVKARLTQTVTSFLPHAIGDGHLGRQPKYLR
jgi:hypothetical protein